MADKGSYTTNKSEIFNLGVSGDMTKDVIARIVVESKTRRWENEEITLIVAIGFNDTLTTSSQGLSSPRQYASELRQLYKEAQTVTRKILFVGLTPVDESLANPWVYNTGTEKLFWSNDRIWQFEQVLRKFVSENSLPFVPLFEAFHEKANAGEQLIADGIHPNEAGHELIYKQVKQALKNCCKFARSHPAKLQNPMKTCR